MKKIKIANGMFVILFIILTLYAVSLLLPLLWGVMTSFKDQTAFEMNPFGFPDVWHFGNYIKALDLFCVRINVLSDTVAMRMVYLEEMLFNSLFYCVGCAFFASLAPLIVSYITAKYKFKFLKVINAFVIFAMILPIVGNFPSEMQMVKTLNLYDNIIGLYFMKFSFLGMYYLIFYASFKNLSWEYAEAGIIDGASNFTIMLKIMFPLVGPTFGVVMLLQFINFWNDYMTPLMYLPSHPTVAIGLFNYYTSPGQENSLVPMQIAGCMVIMLPILIIFVIFRDKIMRNVSIGGLKG